MNRKGRLINLYQSEEHALMQEFEEMKRNEILNKFDDEKQLISKYQVEQEQEFENIRDRAKNIKVTTDNAVRQERMNLELAKTAN